MKKVIMKTAWEIRRAAALKFGCRVSEIMMSACLKLAWADAKQEVTMIDFTLQSQLSNGNWVDCGDETEKYLTLIMKNEGMSRRQVIDALKSGKKLRNDPRDWYSNCRMKPAPRVAPPIDNRVQLRCKKCGTIGYAGDYPFSTLAHSGLCDDCL